MISDRYELLALREEANAYVVETLKKSNNVVSADLIMYLIDVAMKIKGHLYIYKSENEVCRNFDHEGAPKCIIGHVFWMMGLQLKDCGNLAVDISLDRLEQMRPELRFTVGAVTAMDVAQEIQDSGGSWGTARTTARRVAISVNRSKVGKNLYPTSSEREEN